MIIYRYEDFIARLNDLKRLAQPPLEGEKAWEFSSTDKRSRYDKEHDRYLDWGANADADGILYTQEDGGRVLAELNGPGCLTRIWFAAPGQEGHISIYLDDMETPAVSCATRRLFGEGEGPFSLSHLCYVPMPFARHCKIVGYGDFGAFYQFSFIQLAASSIVETFRLPLSTGHMNALTEADAALSNIALPRDLEEGERCLQGGVSLEPGVCEAPLKLEGAGAITFLKFHPDETSWRTLKRLVIEIYWDGEDAPSVWAPFCDFFGGGCGLNAYRSLPLCIEEDGVFSCRFFMPFSNGARILLHNLADIPVKIAWEARVQPFAEPPEALRFHAKWHRNAHLPARGDRWPDYTLLRAEGKGRYLGCTLHVYKPADNRDMKCVPGEYWWGEGDEKFFVDGETFPSVFGTGTEDYFGFAWAWPDLFARPYHTQNFNQGGIHNRGNRSFARFHIPDDIPFHSGIEACIEKYYDENFARYAITAYWYQEAGRPDLYNAYDVDALTGYYSEDPETCPELPIPGAAYASISFEPGDNNCWTLADGKAFENAGIVKLMQGVAFTYATDSDDGKVCSLSSPAFVLKGPCTAFLLGGTWRRDPEGSFVALVRKSDGAELACSCCESEALRRVVWDVRDYISETCVIRIIDEGKGGCRGLTVADFRVQGRLLPDQ